MNAHLPILITSAPGRLVQALRRCIFGTLLVALSSAAAAQSPSALNRLLFDPHLLPDSSNTQAEAGTAPAALSFDDEDTEPYLAGQVDDRDVDAYLQSIADTELEGGPFAPELLEQYLALGESHQALADHEAALAAFEKAEYISRINNGLHAPEQFAIVENMIESHLARDELQEAGNKQRYLLMLHEEQYGATSLELVPALMVAADWNFSVFNRQLSLPNTVISFGSGRGPGPMGFGSVDGIGRFGGAFGGRRDTQSPRAMAFGSLFQSQVSYWRAINILLNNRLYSDPRLPALEHRLIETAFLSSNREGLLRNPEFYLNQRNTHTGSRIRHSTRPNSPQFFTGRSAYERLLAYKLMTPGTDAVTIAQSLIALGDWHLLYDRQGTALRTYERAQRFLSSNKVPQEQIDALLAPAIPQQLPTFTPIPHSRARFGLAADAELAWDGYVDVRFRISRFGKAGRFEVLASEGPWTNAMESRLRRLVQGSPFRPRFVAGEPVAGEYLTLRYYFAQMD